MLLLLKEYKSTATDRCLICVLILGAHRSTTRQLSLDAVDEHLRLRMLQILNKSSRHEMEEELQKLRIELSAKGRQFFRCYVSSILPYLLDLLFPQSSTFVFEFTLPLVTMLWHADTDNAKTLENCRSNY
jgi:hypothetical protein